MAGEDFLLAAFDIRNWNQELSPWEAPPVWGTEAFGNGAAAVSYTHLFYTLVPAHDRLYRRETRQLHLSHRRRRSDHGFLRKRTGKR